MIQETLASPASASPSAPPRVWDFADYRAYLSEWMQFKKVTSHGFSGAAFARKARLQSHTLLGLVARGKRNLSAQSIRAFARGLDLSAREAQYFEKLVLFNQSRDSEDKRFYFDQVQALAQGAGKRSLEVIRDYGEYLRHWYIPAVRELVRLPDFAPQAEWISARLKHRISKSEAQSAWDVLLRLGFVRPITTGGRSKTLRFEIAQPRIDIAPGEVDFVIRNYHREQLTRAQAAIDGEPITERHLSSLTLSLSARDYAHLQQRLEEFRKALNSDFSQEGGSPDRVAIWNSQLIQVTSSPSQIEEKS